LYFSVTHQIGEHDIDAGASRVLGGGQSFRRESWRLLRLRGERLPDLCHAGAPGCAVDVVVRRSEKANALRRRHHKGGTGVELARYVGMDKSLP